jgi:hypothetical protein
MMVKSSYNSYIRDMINLVCVNCVVLLSFWSLMDVFTFFKELYNHDLYMTNEAPKWHQNYAIHTSYSYLLYRVFNLKVDRQLSLKYLTSDAIYNGSAGITLYYYMCRSWQDCCRRGENRSWPSVADESVDSECWCLNNAKFLRFHNAVNSGRTCIYFKKLFKNDVLRPL